MVHVPIQKVTIHRMWVTIGGIWSLSPAQSSFCWLLSTNTSTDQEEPLSLTRLLSQINRLLRILLTKVTLHLSRSLDLHLVLLVQVTIAPKWPTAWEIISRVWKSSGKAKNMTQQVLVKWQFLRLIPYHALQLQSHAQHQASVGSSWPWPPSNWRVELDQAQPKRRQTTW